ncbi:MAG: hypothetical protein OEZ06_15065 [Myxococcales bacterium]|nr:hypothetical protein [Myxococcales bacterium]
MTAQACNEARDGVEPTLKAPAAGEPLPVDPGLICGEQLRTDVSVNGEGLSPIPVNVPKDPTAALPGLYLLQSAALDGSEASEGAGAMWSGESGADPTNAFDEDGEPLLRWESQQQMVFTVHPELTLNDESSGPLPAGLYDVAVENGNGHRATAERALAVLARPTLDAVTPSLLCLEDAARTIALEGMDLARIEDQGPSLELGDQSFEATTSDCSDIAHAGVQAALCNAAEVSLEMGALPAGSYTATLRNPEPAACFSTEEHALHIVSAPRIERITPDGACIGDDQVEVAIEGSDFLVIDGDEPSVLLDGDGIAIVGVDGCEALESVDYDVQRCSRIALGPIASALAEGAHELSVKNPEPALCTSTLSEAFYVLPPPTLERLETVELCADTQVTLVLIGSSFREGVHVRAGDSEADSVEVLSDTRIEATFDSGLAAGSYDVSVEVGDGSCASTLALALTVDPEPLIFFVDPPVIYNGASVVSTIFASGLRAEASSLELLASDGSATEITSWDSPTRPNRIEATIEAGLDAGSYGIRITSHLGCVGSAADLLTVTDTLGLDVDSIEPGFVSPTRSTAVTLRSSDGDFVAVPRVYLKSSSTGAAAIPLSAVVVQDGNTLSTVIPAGLAPGEYSVIVVNPDGSVGILDAALVAALTVMAVEPPVIDNVVPASLVAKDTPAELSIRGSGFDVDSLELECKDPDGNLTSVSGSVVGTPTASEIVASFSPGGSSVPGSTCLLHLLNADGSRYSYSALSLTNDSLNLSAWSAGSPLLQPRRALSAVAGRPTAASRYVYAIGGDSGVTGDATAIGSVLDSVEAAPVDVFGTMGAFAAQRNALPAPRTWAGAARIERFVYLVGGHDGGGATSSLLRAQILDPLATPSVVDADAHLGDGSSGLGQGLWMYRVAAVFAADDASNPAGESLPGEVFTLQLPARAEGIEITLTWEMVAGASGYRIYRNPSAGSGAMELLAEVDGGSTLSHVDAGGATQAATTPLPAGSLGRWHAVDGARCSDGDCELDGAREALGVVAVADPNTAGRHYLYAIGGRDASGSYLDSYEVATVSVAANGSQTVSAFALGSDTLASPRAEMGIWAMHAGNSKAIRDTAPTEVWIFIGSGRTTAGAGSAEVEAGEVGNGGDLGTLTATDSMPQLAGFGTGAANDRLYTFGGLDNTTSGTSAVLCADPDCLPDLAPGSFNSLAQAATRRIYTVAAQESAFFFLLGGHNGDNALATTERTVQ